MAAPAPDKAGRQIYGFEKGRRCHRVLSGGSKLGPKLGTRFGTRLGTRLAKNAGRVHDTAVEAACRLNARLAGR